MGLRNSKNKKSYDIAPIVSDKEIGYKKAPRPIPHVELPAVVVTPEQNVEQTKNATEPKVEVQQVQTTSLVVENSETKEVEPVVEVQQIQTTSLVVESLEVEPVAEVQPIQTTSLVVEEPQDPRIPSWVNESNFQDLVTKSNPSIKEIINFKAFPAMAAGENYATLMLRVKMSAKLEDDSLEDFSFMLKVAHDNKEMKEMMQVMNFFVTENCVYTDIIPVFEDMYRQAGVDVSFAAKSHRLSAVESDVHYVLLDDLNLGGFKNVNRLECLNMEHTLMVLRKLAQFHAASACHAANKGPYPEMFAPDMDNEMLRNMMGQMFMGFKKPFLENLKTYENGDRYYDAMDKFFDNLIDEFIAARKADSKNFNVLNHGDSWSNNILFKYSDDGKLDEALFVDFQNTNWGTPAQDLFYFIISSVQIDIKLSQYDYFIRYYHQHLTENLILLKYPLKIPNLQEFHIQMIDFGSWATVTSFLTLGVVLLDPTDNAKFENFIGEAQESIDFKNSLYRNERYIKYMNEILPWLHNRGFMESRYVNSDKKPLSTDKLVEPVTTIAATTVEEKSVQSSTTYPEWVNESLFIDVIRADFENYQKILKFTVSPATSAGDNYSSIMLKIDIDIELTDHNTHNLSYMLKIPPTGEQSKAIIKMMKSFEKEIAAYYEIIPQLEKVLKEQAGTEVVFGPKCYKLTKDTECETIVLENLRIKGFKNGDRLEGLDMEHTKAVLKKLAEFHAASAYLFATKGKFPEVFEFSMFNEESRAEHEKFNESFFKIIKECLEQYEGHKEYIDNLSGFFDTSSTCLIEANQIDWNKFNVLNHGDCWVNNIMFQHDDQGNISNTYFVDYQLTKYGSPAYDLYYFLLSSPKLELKVEQFDYFVRYYHENLKATLELLKYPNEIPKLKELHMELLDNGPLAVNTVMGVMSAVLLEPSDSSNLETMMSVDAEGTDLKKQMYISKRYRSHAELIYPWLNKRGLLEFKTELPTKLESHKKLTVPSWVNAEYFEDILRENLDNFEKILNITTTPATKSGDNYSSNLLRVKVEVQLRDKTTQTMSYILKMELKTENDRKNIMWYPFDKEITVYSKYLREFEKMYHEVGQEIIFGPKSYSFKKEVGKDVILMEDLSQNDFKCGDRREGLNMEHVKCVLRKLAQFHAVSAKYVEVNGPYPEEFRKGIHNEENRAFFESIDIEFFFDYFKQYEGYEEYQDKLPNLFYNSVDHGMRCANVDPAEFNVLNHGDLWTNNIMFKHKEQGQVMETYFLDFPDCKYGSPALDLWHFIITSAELAIKIESFDYFIKYYHDNLMKNINLLKYSGKVPKLSELHIVMLKYGYFGFYTFNGTCAVCLLESSENANVENFVEGEKFRELLFLNDSYKLNAAVVLPWLARRGCLD